MARVVAVGEGKERGRKGNWESGRNIAVSSLTTVTLITQRLRNETAFTCSGKIWQLTRSLIYPQFFLESATRE